MPASLEGRVAFITGVARGQGRAHAVRLAREGVDIIGVDICENYPHMDYPNATPEDLQETQALVEKEGRRAVLRKADVRDYAQLKAAFDEGYAEFGRVDIILANAGIIRMGDEEDFEAEWREVIDTNLTGPFNTVRVALPAMRAGGRGGSIIITSSVSGIRALTSEGKASYLGYASAKHGLVGMKQMLANDLAPEWIRVNTIHPTGVLSGMTMNDAMARLSAAAAEGEDNVLAPMQNALPVPILQPEDIANAVAFLVSDEAKNITGISLPVDAGFCVR